jgi:hypothetical protein
MGRVKRSKRLNSKPKEWTIYALSFELNIDRRTLPKILKDVEPCNTKWSNNLYYMTDVLQALGNYRNGMFIRRYFNN